uniref:Iron-uptake system-binding protein n=1 Tax=Thermosporothrix sp. COM3 TaxID=2490863 RepID=A0A455SQK2_9CHLR|nr:iron-uptake system-binding protein [Thermosporothrix sp. COM3]
MSNKWHWMPLLCCICLLLAACGGASQGAQEKQMRKITYFGKEIEVPVKVERTVAADTVVIEDLVMMDIPLVGGATYPDGPTPHLADKLKNMKSIGTETPNYEAILQLKPDLIFIIDRWSATIIQQLRKIAPVIVMKGEGAGHGNIATPWKENIRMLGEVYNKQARANEILKEYQQKLATAKADLEKSPEKKQLVVMTMRIRGSGIYIYTRSGYINSVLYDDLGFPVPDVVKQAQGQDNLPLEKLAEIDPDVLYLQFAPQENTNQPAALENLQKNPLWTNLKAVKNGHAFINKFPPLAWGSTSWSAVHALSVFEETLF